MKTTNTKEWNKNKRHAAKPAACDIVLAKLKYFPEYSNPYVTVQWNGQYWWNDENEVKYQDGMIEKFIIIENE